MPELAPNRPFDSPEPVLRVDNALAVGAHRFALSVVDDRGRESLADAIVVEVRRAIAGPVPPPIVPPIAVTPR
jgi:hypothetical protein